MEQAPALAVRGLGKSYGGRAVVAGASFELQPGKILCLLGPSGCGKSTLLRMIAGLERPDEGEVEAGGRRLAAPGLAVPPEARGIGMVFQDFALFPHLSAAKNVAFGLRHLPGRARRQRALALLEQFRLGGRSEAYPHTLSGGEQQRVAIARALAPRPAALLLDEPFSGLDGDMKAELRHAVLAGLRAEGTAVLMVTHDPEEALLMGDALALMSEGRILQCGTPEQCYLRPRSIVAARLLGEANILAAEVAGGEARTVFGSVPANGAADGPATLIVRPEGLRLAGEEGAPAELVRVRFGGAWRELTLQAGGTEATARLSAGPVPACGPVRIAIDPACATLIEPD